MRNKEFDYLLDDYLLDRLSLDGRERFEKHYFTAPRSFKKILEREEIISVIKQRGDIVFQELEDIDRETEHRSKSSQGVDSHLPIDVIRKKRKI